MHQSNKEKKELVIATSLALFVIVSFFIFDIGGVKNTTQDDTPQSAPSETAETGKSENKIINNKNTQKNMEELKLETIVEGTGEEAKVGDIVSVHYTGKLTDGTVFDSSIPRGQTFEFRLGEGRVIAGWEEGVKGMKTGEKRVLTIPSHMAYGSNGVPNGQGGYVIPPNATLIFEVELVSIK